MSKSINFEEIKNKLKQSGFLIGSEIYHFTDTNSTMSLAKDIFKTNPINGALIIADKQSGGRGRLGRTWSSPLDGLWISIILTPDLPPEKTSMITLLTGISLCKTIEKLYNIKPGLKWPNDVLLNGKKICGILTEGVIEGNKNLCAILGIGVNLNFKSSLLPDELRSIATTLFSETSIKISKEDFLFELLINLNKDYNVFLDDNSILLKEYSNYCITFNQRVTAIYKDKQIQGIARSITNTGSLIIEVDSGDSIVVCSGEVSVRAM